MFRPLPLLFLAALLVAAPALRAQAAQKPAPAQPAPAPNAQPAQPNPQPTPGQLELITLEGRFAADTVKGGGKAFASWFADDAVTLSNGQAARIGKASIAASATWDPKDFQLTWYPEGAMVGPSGDTGYTWGHYDATSKDKTGQQVTTGGRYITFWKKVNGVWKVALDASANDAPPGFAPPPVPKQ